MGQSAVIEVHDLRKTYREGWFRRRTFEALKGISLEVRPGEIFGLLGPNGAGKTTFIKILLGIIRRSGGEAMLLGHSAGSSAGRRRVGYLPENLRIPRHLNARTALEYYGGLSNMSPAQVRTRREELLTSVGLADRAKDSVRKYSKGMLQRLGLAQALLHDPDLLILDEPTYGLDPRGRAHVRSLLAEIKSQGKTIFLNSHILQEVELVCDRVAILDLGVLRYVGPVQEVTAHVSGKAGPQLQLTLKLAGPEGALERALAGIEIVAWRRGEPHEVVARLENQDGVDALIDRCRAGGISILEMSRARVSLEDAFLRILETPATAELVEERA